MKVLHLNLYRKYFDAILKGDKVVEYKGMYISGSQYALVLGDILESENVA